MDRGSRQRRRAFLLLPLLLAAGSSGPAAAAPPITTYRIEATTGSGLGAIGMDGPNLMQMMMGDRPAQQVTTSRRLELFLESPGTAPTPTAEHRIPAAMALGAALPLASTTQREVERVPPGEIEIPDGKGRLLIFRGCGEQAGAGQPEIISLAGVKPDQRQRIMLGALEGGPGPTLPPGTALGTNGRWPSGDNPPRVPMTASLVGEHRVVSNYAPEIRFPVEASHDFLAPLQVGTGPAGGATRLNWPAVPTALGYLAIATGAGRQSDDMVIWTSSEAPGDTGSVPDGLRRPEAAALVQRKVLLPPERTTCVVSAEAMAAMPMAVLTLTAYGDTLLLTSPPASPAWRVAIERRSTATRMLGEGMEKLNPAGGGEPGQPEAKPRGFNPFRFF
jgi:hypothetical protein